MHYYYVYSSFLHFTVLYKRVYHEYDNKEIIIIIGKDLLTNLGVATCHFIRNSISCCIFAKSLCSRRHESCCRQVASVAAGATSVTGATNATSATNVTGASELFTSRRV